MNDGPWKSILPRLIGVAVIGIPIGFWQGLSEVGWLLYLPAILLVAALSGFASWLGARKAEERIANKSKPRKRR